ncbi:MAG: VOC family protein [Pseudomonadota bacterium]|nr:MAG: VOC family protein [Pseudomonadota bacterium]
MVNITALDHLVLTVRDIAQTCEFYHDVLGMEVVRFGEGRTALRFGDSKINLHQAGNELAPTAGKPTPGSADVCLISDTPLEEVQVHLAQQGVTIELGPVERTGALGTIRSVYIRDPDTNLIEIANRLR